MEVPQKEGEGQRRLIRISCIRGVACGVIWNENQMSIPRLNKGSEG